MPRAAGARLHIISSALSARPIRRNAMVDAPRPEAALRNFEAASPRPTGDSARVRARRRSRSANGRGARDRSRTRGAGAAASRRACSMGHQDHGLLAVQRCGRIGLAHENEDSQRGSPRAGRSTTCGRCSRNDRRAHDGRLDIRGIARRDVRARSWRRPSGFAVEQRLEPSLLLFGRGIAGQHFHVAGIRGRALKASGARCERPMISQHQAGAYSRLVRPAQCSECGRKRFTDSPPLPGASGPPPPRRPPGIAVAAVSLHFFVEAPLRRVRRERPMKRSSCSCRRRTFRCARNPCFILC